MGKYIPVDDIVAGMTLADPIVNKYGQVIMAAGVQLGTHHIIKLKTWGITHVSIESHGESGISVEIRAIARERLEKRLTWDFQHPLEEDMYAAAIELTAIKIMNGTIETL